MPRGDRRWPSTGPRTAAGAHDGRIVISREPVHGPIVIRITIETTEPLAGLAASQTSETVHFDGWLGLLAALAELVGAAGQDVGCAPHH